MEHDLLTVSEVAKHLRVDTTTVRRWAQQGILEVIRLPSSNGKYQKYRIRKATLERIVGKTTANKRR